VLVVLVVVKDVLVVGVVVDVLVLVTVFVFVVVVVVVLGTIMHTLPTLAVPIATVFKIPLQLS
jgi:hypothetical protein